MKNSLVALAILALTTAVPTLADTYTATVVAHTQDENFYGIDAIGDFTINVSNNASLFAGCGGMDFRPCYETFYRNQSSPVITTAPPSLTLDDGSPCTPVVAPGMEIFNAVCNNGHEIYGGLFNSATIGVWTGPDPIADLLLSPGSFDGGFINSKGDAVFIDGHDDELIFADDLTSDTPEPSSFVLLGTGCLSMLGVFRLKRT